MSYAGTTLAVDDSVPTKKATAAPPSRDQLLGELCALIQKWAVTKRAPGEPDFVLASGRHSRYYCDTKRVTLSPEGALLTGQILLDLLDGRAEAVGGLELGATFIATAVALVSGEHDRPIYGFTVRDEQKRHGTRERVAQSFHPDGSELLCCGRRVAVVDDVVTGGGSILRAITAVQEMGCEIVAVVALVDRNEGGGELLRGKNLPYYALFNADSDGNLKVNADLPSSGVRLVHRTDGPLHRRSAGLR
jgi:orotate phosphoribosyltransferase